MTARPVIVLRGNGAVLRFEADTVTLRRADEELSIPLDAIGEAFADGRAVEVRLTAPDGVDAVVYRVEDVSEAAVAAFVDGVNALLTARPDGAPRSDGSALVTRRSVAADAAPRFGGRRAALVAALVAFVALDVTLGVAGSPQYAAMLAVCVAFGSAGVLTAFLLGQGLYRMWRLPKHGITVMAEFSHYTNNSKVYRYTDSTGATHTHTATGGDRVELSYDPQDPRRAVVPVSLTMRCMMVIPLLIGLGMAGGALTGLGVMVADAFTG